MAVDDPLADSGAAARAATVADAQLILHAPFDLAKSANGLSSIPSILWRFLVPQRVGARGSTPVHIHVADLNGRELHCIDSAMQRIALSMPPGTYDVTVTRGNVRRRYTLTLASGASFDLHLPSMSSIN